MELVIENHVAIELSESYFEVVGCDNGFEGFVWADLLLEKWDVSCDGRGVGFDVGNVEESVCGLFVED